MAKIWLARIELILADPKIHAKKFHHPAKKPTTLEYLDGVVIDAQWYTPLDDGTALASSAMQAAIIQ